MIDIWKAFLDVTKGWTGKKHTEEEHGFTDTEYICVGIVYISNSWQVVASIEDSQKVAKYYSIFTNTMYAIARNFGAKVPYQGIDKVISFFPITSEPSSDKTPFKDVLKCALTMLAAHGPMNEKCRDHHLPPINYRISSDYGKIEVAKSGPSRVVDDIYRLSSPIVNMCLKINSKAPLNGVVIGGDLYQIIKGLHESSSTSFVIKQMGAYSVEGPKTPSYPLYSVTTGVNLAIPAIVMPPEEGAQFNIMLIADEPGMIIKYKSFLHPEGYKVDAFSNSQEALRHFAQVSPSYYDLVIMDIRTRRFRPNLNGLQLYDRMKAINSSVKVLFVSAPDAVEELVSILPDIKRNSIIRKPVEKDHFVRTVQLAISQ